MKAIAKVKNKWYLGTVDDTFAEFGVEKQITNLAEEKENMITIKAYCRHNGYKDEDDKKIMDVLGVKRLYVNFEIKTGKKGKRRPKKAQDPYLVDRELMLKYGPKIHTKCILCDNECKQQKRNFVNDGCEGFSPVEGISMELRRKQDFYEQYGKNLKLYTDEWRKFCVEFYKAEGHWGFWKRMFENRIDEQQEN